MQQILFTICGRAGSKGIKNKNIRNFLGHPLILYTTKAIELFIEQNPEYNCEIALSTDSLPMQEIVAKHHKGKIEIIDRPIDLAGDFIAKSEVIAHALETMEKLKEKKYTLIIDLDITAPLRKVQDIKKLVEKSINSEYEVVFSVVGSRRNPYFNMVQKEDSTGGYKRVVSSNFVARQQAPTIYDMNASMYAYKRGFFLDKKGIFDTKCGIIEMLDTAVLDLDHEADFELLEVLAEFFYKKDPEFKEIYDKVKQEQK